MSLFARGKPLRHVLVVGYGATGRAVAAYCTKHGIAFSLTEARDLPDDDLAWLRRHADGVETGGHTLRLLDRVDAAVLSPGVPLDAPIVRAAAERGLPVLSELDLATAAGLPAPVIAVTGTNGKSTTVSLIGEILRAMGLRALVGGNIGTPLVGILDEAAGADAVVVEVSSFQLEQSGDFHPQVAVLLNLAPNHLEHHGSMDAYRSAKERIFARQAANDAAILPFELAADIRVGRGRVITYDRPFPPMPRGSDRLSRVQQLDMAAAVAACLALHPGSDPSRLAVEQLASALHLPHRQQDVGSILGIRLIDDSKATSPAATIAALESVLGPVVLLLGGRSKKGGYDELARTLRGDAAVRDVIVYGEARDEISGHLATAGVRHRMAADLEAAVEDALRRAHPGDAVLLSPACSSFDQFSSFEGRGDAFVRLCRRSPGFTPFAPKDA